MPRLPPMGRATVLLAILLGAACAAPKPAAPDPIAAPPPPPPAPPPPPVAPPAAPPPAAKEPDGLKAHKVDVWVAKRAERLGMDEATAKARDDSFVVSPPEDGLWWDGELAAEVHEVWNVLCRECHQGNRSKEKVLKMPPPPRGWSSTKTQFFKWEHVPTDAFRILAEGQKSSVISADAKDMPAWANRLSNEQMWGLVYFIAAASKKKGHDLQ